MRGKKVDKEFLSEFIMSCIMSGKTSPREFLAAALERISLIDEKIQEVNELKVMRSKLLDVVESFKEEFPDNNDEALKLKYLSIPNPNICQFICKEIAVAPIAIERLLKRKFEDNQIFFCIKELLAQQIIGVTDKILNQGPNYSSYMRATSI